GIPALFGMVAPGRLRIFRGMIGGLAMVAFGGMGLLLRRMFRPRIRMFRARIRRPGSAEKAHPRRHEAAPAPRDSKDDPEQQRQLRGLACGRCGIGGGHRSGPVCQWQRRGRGIAGRD
ncbi:MAG: hypothetical protein ACK56I_20465, partial [bacterium]